MITVELNEGEIAVARLIAELRHTGDFRNGVEDLRQWKDIDGLQVNIDGIGAELAVARIMNLYPDLSVKLIPGNYDLLSRTGKKLDVKCNRSPTAKGLYVMGHKKIGQADIYIHVTGRIPVYQIHGWVSEADILRPENLKDYGYGPVYYLPKKQVWPLKDPR